MNESKQRAGGCGTGDASGYSYPPRDVHDIQGWNSYWQSQSKSKYRWLSDEFINDYWLATTLKRLSYRTILCAGNGLSLEPLALAAAGFDVTVTDLSPWAMEYLSQLKPKPDFENKMYKRYLALPFYYWPRPPYLMRDLLDMCAYNFRKFRSDLFSLIRSGGGALRFRAGDLLEPAFCEGPYDSIIERCVVQLFAGEEQNEILQKLSNRLSPKGIFVSHCHMGWWKPDDPNPFEHPLASWFRQNEFTVIRENYFHEIRVNKNSGRIARLSSSTG